MVSDLFMHVVLTGPRRILSRLKWGSTHVNDPGTVEKGHLRVQEIDVPAVFNRQNGCNRSPREAAEQLGLG